MEVSLEEFIVTSMQENSGRISEEISEGISGEID